MTINTSLSFGDALNNGCFSFAVCFYSVSFLPSFLLSFVHLCTCNIIYRCTNNGSNEIKSKQPIAILRQCSQSFTLVHKADACKAQYLMVAKWHVLCITIASHGTQETDSQVNRKTLIFAFLVIALIIIVYCLFRAKNIKIIQDT